MDELGRLTLYLCKHVTFEYMNFYLQSQYSTKENFNEFTVKMLKSYERKDLIWNIFNANEFEAKSSYSAMTNNIKSILVSKKPLK